MPEGILGPEPGFARILNGHPDVPQPALQETVLETWVLGAGGQEQLQGLVFVRPRGVEHLRMRGYLCQVNSGQVNHLPGQLTFRVGQLPL